MPDPHLVNLPFMESFEHVSGRDQLSVFVRRHHNVHRGGLLRLATPIWLPFEGIQFPTDHSNDPIFYLLCETRFVIRVLLHIISIIQHNPTRARGLRLLNRTQANEGAC